MADGPSTKFEKPDSTPRSRERARPRWLAALPHAQRATSAFGDVTVLIIPGLRPKRRVSIDVPPGWTVPLEAGECACTCGEARAKILVIFTGIDPGKASDWNTVPLPGYAIGGRSKALWGGESPPEGFVSGDCTGDELDDDPDDESARLAWRRGEGATWWWEGRTMGLNDGGSCAVRCNGVFAALVAGDAVLP